MFKKEDIELIDRKYFTVIVANAYDITLISNNTHHVWYIHNVELPDRELCIVFHKHKASHPYHNHTRYGRAWKISYRTAGGCCVCSRKMQDGGIDFSKLSDIIERQTKFS